MLLETCCILLSVIDMLEGRRRGEMCAWGGGRGNGLSSNSVCMANGLNYKAYTWWKITNSYSAGHELSTWTTMPKGNHSLYKPVHEIWTHRISTKTYKIVYFGVSRGTRCIQVVRSLLQHSYFVYARCKKSVKAMRMHRFVGAFATHRCKKN